MNSRPRNYLTPRGGRLVYILAIGALAVALAARLMPEYTVIFATLAGAMLGGWYAWPYRKES